ncbi:ATP-utilizing chromatin assembly and remodelling N-terminal [Carpediemonas membranifera]|uniref:ATP-utilizing chromatin assembly and remodelling N-terminal n=1 Tax=Carpediemonas membranifera TaxID=201153 RepID=A0A8J6E8G7_9EUKA|nr:ATP-utilizing chromatin assembly and remodelling N-terminal [Carpediemonas membranifera]|eukprot:KAG9391885.1 ATP-utilizing chromatin assembly and remodelling N-terminal [Carpediemonas membranifera]
MPIKDGKDVPLAPKPVNLKVGENVYIMPETNEVFRTYSEYIARRDMYFDTVFMCKYTRKNGMTYPEAYESERNFARKVSSMPKPVLREICKKAHLSTLSTQDLVTDITTHLSTCLYEHQLAYVFVPGEKGPVALPCTVTTPGLTRKASKTVKLTPETDPNKRARVETLAKKRLSKTKTQPTVEPAPTVEFEVTRDKVFIDEHAAETKEHIRGVLRLVTRKTDAKTAGVVVPRYRRLFDLPEPPKVLPAIVTKPRKARQQTLEAALFGAQAKLARSGDGSKTSAPKTDSTYPMPDELLEDKDKTLDRTQWVKDMVSPDLKLSGADVSALMTVADFVANFGSRIRFRASELDDLVKTLTFTPSTGQLFNDQVSPDLYGIVTGVTSLMLNEGEFFDDPDSDVESTMPHKRVKVERDNKDDEEEEEDGDDEEEEDDDEVDETDSDAPAARPPPRKSTRLASLTRFANEHIAELYAPRARRSAAQAASLKMQGTIADDDGGDEYQFSDQSEESASDTLLEDELAPYLRRSTRLKTAKQVESESEEEEEEEDEEVKPKAEKHRPRPLAGTLKFRQEFGSSDIDWITTWWEYLSEIEQSQGLLDDDLQWLKETIIFMTACQKRKSRDRDNNPMFIATRLVDLPMSDRLKLIKVLVNEMSLTENVRTMLKDVQDDVERLKKALHSVKLSKRKRVKELTAGEDSQSAREKTALLSQLEDIDKQMGSLQARIDAGQGSESMVTRLGRLETKKLRVNEDLQNVISKAAKRAEKVEAELEREEESLAAQLKRAVSRSTSHLGQDRRFGSYWLSPLVPGALLTMNAELEWGVVDVADLLAYCDERGRRELSLKRHVEKHRESIELSSPAGVAGEFGLKLRVRRPDARTLAPPAEKPQEEEGSDIENEKGAGEKEESQGDVDME